MWTRRKIWIRDHPHMTSTQFWDSLTLPIPTPHRHCNFPRLPPRKIRQLASYGASIYDVRKHFGFFDPLPFVTITNQLILFLSSSDQTKRQFATSAGSEAPAGSDAEAFAGFRSCPNRSTCSNWGKYLWCS